ncbi:Methyltransferase [Minicystis rosea]|nr:Methyltransferase [Minicystis rosea]
MPRGSLVSMARAHSHHDDAGDPAAADASNGYEAVASAFMDLRDRSAIGADVVEAWARALPTGASVLDVGCGHGVPISMTLMRAGLSVFGVDASPSLVAAFRSRFPQATVACEPVESSSFFGRTFDAVVAVGLVFLLPPEAQHALVRKLAQASRGRLLFTSPAEACAWTDVLTGRPSRSLGANAYEAMLSDAGFTLARRFVDGGGNHYYDACKR